MIAARQQRQQQQQQLQAAEQLYCRRRPGLRVRARALDDDDDHDDYYFHFDGSRIQLAHCETRRGRAAFGRRWRPRDEGRRLSPSSVCVLLSDFDFDFRAAAAAAAGHTATTIEAATIRRRPNIIISVARYARSVAAPALTAPPPPPASKAAGARVQWSSLCNHFSQQPKPAALFGLDAPGRRNSAHDTAPAASQAERASCRRRRQSGAGQNQYLHFGARPARS